MHEEKFDYLIQKAETLKAIAHPVRLSILCDLAENGEKKVSDLNTGIDLPIAAVSQHLKIMMFSGILSKRRNGTEIHYSIKKESWVIELINNIIVKNLSNLN